MEIHSGETGNIILNGEERCRPVKERMADRHTGAKQGSGHAAKAQSSRGRRGERELALAAVKLSFVHPSTGKNVEFAIKPRGRIFERFGD